MAILPEKVWERHTNPWSGWTRVLSMPLIGVGMYMHSTLILVGAVVWLIVNPWLFPVPKNTNNWMSRGVLGEQLYFKDGRKLRKDLPTLLNVVNLPVFIAFLYLSWQQDLIGMILAGFLTMAIKFWFLDRMHILAQRLRAGEVQYVEFLSQDFSAVREFYSKAFGWQFVEYGTEYLAFNGMYIDGGFAQGEPKAGSVLVILYTDKLEETLNKVKEVGGQITKEIFSFPGGRRFEFADPNGNILAVWSDD